MLLPFSVFNSFFDSNSLILKGIYEIISELYTVGVQVSKVHEIMPVLVECEEEQLVSETDSRSVVALVSAVNNILKVRERICRVSYNSFLFYSD